MLKQHRFWAMVILIGCVMCLWTGHQMCRPKKKEEE